jgi:histidine triad (HIT) family protein
MKKTSATTNTTSPRATENLSKTTPTTPRTAKSTNILLALFWSVTGEAGGVGEPISLFMPVRFQIYPFPSPPWKGLEKCAVGGGKRTSLNAPSKRIYNSASVPEEDCVFCKIVAGKLPSYRVYEDARHVAFLDINPFSKGHTLVCPKRHGETLWDMDEREIAEVFTVASKVSKGVVSAMKADGFRVMQNNGEAANQAVAHIHVHVIPSRLEEKGKFARLKTNEKEMVEVAEAIRTEIARI